MTGLYKLEKSVIDVTGKSMEKLVNRDNDIVNTDIDKRDSMGKNSK